MKKILTLLFTLLFITNLFSLPVAGSPTFNDTCDKIDAYLNQLVKEKNFSGGLLITRQGNVLLNKGYGWSDREKQIPFTPSTLASMGSITKAFTAAGILKLAEQKKLTVDDPLKKFFPAIPTDKSDITIHQLLTHSSGFHDFLQNDGGDYEKIGTGDFLKRAFSEPLSFSPGSKAVYSNAGMSILAIIIEQVSGMDYENYLRKFLFQPAGIEGIGYHYPASGDDTIAVGYKNGVRWGTHQQRFKEAGGGPYWNLKGNGGLEISLNDMIRWVNAVEQHVILSGASVQKMFTKHILEEGYDGQSWFGYGCNISKSRRNTLLIDNGGSNGIYFARLIRLPEEGLVFYMVTNESSVSTNKVLPNVTQLFFQGKIVNDALAAESQFENPLSKKIYDILGRPDAGNLEQLLGAEGLKVNDDMILFEVGQKLISESKWEKALILYQYYTKSFPNIVVAWNDMGDVYRALNKKADAVNCYRQALKLRPGNPRAKENLAQLQ